MLESGREPTEPLLHDLAPSDTSPLAALAPAIDADRMVTIYNPASKDAQRALGRFAAISEAGVTVEHIHTVAGGSTANAEQLYEHRDMLGPRTLLAIIGGDGTAHTVTNALAIVGADDHYVQETKRLFVDGGTAGDTAKALNKPNKLARLDNLLRTGWLRDIYPLEIQVELPGEDTPATVHALSYMSIGGFTGLAAEYINQPQHRNRLLNKYRVTKRLAQGLTGLSALKNADQVDMTIDTDQTRRILDVHCLSGPIMATLKHNSKELTTPGFHVVENTRPAFGHLLTRAILLGAGRLIDKKAAVRDTIQITAHDASLLQADGETWRLPAWSTITVEPGPAISVVTTRPELRPQPEA